MAAFALSEYTFYSRRLSNLKTGLYAQIGVCFDESKQADLLFAEKNAVKSGCAELVRVGPPFSH